MLDTIFGRNIFGDSEAATTTPASAPVKHAENAEPATESTTTTTATTAMNAMIDIRHAIDTHVHWRQRLERFISGISDERLNSRTVAAPDQCELGQWLHGAGLARYGHLDLFTELEAAHAHLHVRSGIIVETALLGKRREALAQLQDVEYSRASAKLKKLLAKIYVEVLCAENPVHGHVDPHPPAVHHPQHAA